jgi:HEAT repeat protein
MEPIVRERAALALRAMTARVLDRVEGCQTVEQEPERQKSVECLVEALRAAVLSWEIHLRPEAVEAALWMGEWLEGTIRQKLQQPRTRIAPVLNELLKTTSDPRLAGFVLRALAIPELRSAAAHAIRTADDPTFIRALLSETRLLADPEIERGCRRIREVRWPHNRFDELLELDPARLTGAVRLIGATGASPEWKISFYRDLASAGNDQVRKAVVLGLVNDAGEAAGRFLALMSCRRSDPLAQIAARELRRRQAEGPTVHASAESGDPNSPPRPNRKRRVDGPRAGAWGSDRRTANADPLAQARARLASPRAYDRTEALQVVRARELTPNLAEEIYRLAHDPDSVVRGLAVAMLEELPGATSRRVVRAAVDDPDERVQANAIEVLDRWDIADRVGCTEPKLESSNNRVRANAIKSLLRLESRKAGNSLLDMLEDTSPAHRLSALWVVGRLKLRAVDRRVRELSSGDPHERIRRRARRVLGELAGEPDYSPQSVGLSHDES